MVLLVIGGLVSGLVGGLVGRTENGDSARSTPSVSECSICSSPSSSHGTLSASATSTVATGPASTPGSSLRSSFKISSIAASRTGNPGHIHIFYLESGTLKARIFGDEGWVSVDIGLSIPAKRGSGFAIQYGKLEMQKGGTLSLILVLLAMDMYLLAAAEPAEPPEVRLGLGLQALGLGLGLEPDRVEDGDILLRVYQS